MSGWATWWARAEAELGIEPWRIPVVILAACGIYFAFLMLVRFFGARALSSLYLTDIVALLMLGAISGRVILGFRPTLAAGVIALAAVFTLAALMRSLQRRFGSAPTAPKPIAIVLDGEVDKARMRRARVSSHDLAAALRQRGIFLLSDVRLVIVEPTGTFTIVRTGQRIDDDLLVGVIGAEGLTPLDGPA